jgi:hypothetical protein
MTFIFCNPLKALCVSKQVWGRLPTLDVRYTLETLNPAIALSLSPRFKIVTFPASSYGLFRVHLNLGYIEEGPQRPMLSP